MCVCDCELDCMGAREHTNQSPAPSSKHEVCLDVTESRKVFFVLFSSRRFCCRTRSALPRWLVGVGWACGFVFVCAHFPFQLFDSFTYCLPLLFYPIYLGDGVARVIFLFLFCRRPMSLPVFFSLSGSGSALSMFILGFGAFPRPWL